VVLLHGFPASSSMFRDLIPLLADRYHLIALDHVGFGLSDAPAAEQFGSTFDALASLTSDLLGVVRPPAGPDEREGRTPSSRRRCAVRQTQIDRKPRAVAARRRRQREQVLPVSLRDPEIVRAKHLQRKSPP
jgi:hypothetical protein